MRNGLNLGLPQPGHFWALLGVVAICLGFGGRVCGQTDSTGALTGLTLDPSGALLSSAEVRLINQETADIRAVTSDESGRFTFLLVLPGRYQLQTSKELKICPFKHSSRNFPLELSQ